MTCTQGQGSELDFVIVSRTLEALTTIRIDWAVPWKPHCALIVSIKGAGAADPQWRVQQFSKLALDLAEDEWPRVSATNPEIMCAVGDDPAGLRGNLWKQTRGNAQQADVWLEAANWPDEATAFCVKVCDAFHGQRAEGLQRLLEEAQVSESEAQVAQSRQSQSLQDFKQLRRQQWVGIWGEARRELVLSQELVTKAQESTLPSITGDEISVIVHKAADKAGGLDGLTYAGMRGLLKQAYEELATVLNAAEAELQAPIHWTQNQQWMRETQASTPWDRATPGNTCLQVAIHRLLKGEVLEQRLVDANFPPKVAALTLQAYRGTRHIVSEDILSACIHPEKGILAGCRFATAMARVYLKPILQDVSSCEGLKGLDTWVDDIGADFEAHSPLQVAKQAFAGYRKLATLLADSGLKLSEEKTGFLASTKEARKALQEVLTTSDPKIFQSMRDLGVDCGLGRVRRVKVQRKRWQKGRGRKQKLDRLRVPDQSFRIRLFCGGVCSSLMWGHQAQGFPPSRVTWLRRAVGQQMGLHKMGCLEVALAAQSHRVRDPWADVLTQQVQSWFKALDRWGRDKAPIARVWEQTAASFSDNRQNWHHVKGPLAATVGHMTGIQWNVQEAFVWKRPGQGAKCRALIDDVKAEGCRRIARKVNCPELVKGIDWSVGRKLLSRFMAKGDALRYQGLKALWQGSLVHDGNSPVKTCPKCNVAASWRHVLLDCDWWLDKGFDTPHWYNHESTVASKLPWTRGLRVATRFAIPELCESTGLWQDAHTIDGRGLTFSTDASGGPFTRDARLRVVAVSVAAFKWVDNQPQTVFRGELFAVLLSLQHVEGPIDCTMDCLGVHKRLRGTCQGKFHADLWEQVRQQDPQRLKTVWINSHLGEREFVEKFGADQLWRRDTNAVADKLCNDLAHKLANHQGARTLHAEDAVFEATLELLSGRAAKVLTSQGDEAHPCVKSFEAAKAAKKQASQVDIGGKPRLCRKRIGANVGHGHTQSQAEWFLTLVHRAQDASGHSWRWQGLDLSCERCSLKLLHSKNRKVLEARAATPCGADGPATFDGVHATHCVEMLTMRRAILANQLSSHRQASC
ncbi:unnamed protein product [Symbiodinium sp. CCMP2592]|nr:unnamed protein product [Symbiodinium sp. CCMP2592]